MPVKSDKVPLIMSRRSVYLGGLIALSLPVLGLPGLVSGFDSHTEPFVQIESERGLPVRGTVSARVLEQYGEPDLKTDPVGEPPISRWDYPEFRVYFERAMVITSVATDDRLPVQLKEIQ